MFHIGEHIWLFVLAIRVGSTKKFTSLWKGLHTIIDKTSPFNYKIQLIGSCQQKIVHLNWLKLCFGEVDVDQQSMEVSLPRYDVHSFMADAGHMNTTATKL